MISRLHKALKSGLQLAPGMSLPSKRNQLRVIVMHKDGHSTQVSITFTGCNPVRHGTVHCTGKMGSCIRMPHSCLQKIFPIWSIMCHPGSAKKSEWVTLKTIMHLHPDWQTFRTYSNISVRIISLIHHHSMHIWVSHSFTLFRFEEPKLHLLIGTVTPMAHRRPFRFLVP